MNVERLALIRREVKTSLGAKLAKLGWAAAFILVCCVAMMAEAAGRVWNDE